VYQVAYSGISQIGNVLLVALQWASLFATLLAFAVFLYMLL